MGKYKLSRSVSLNRIDQADGAAVDGAKPNPKKRKEPPSPKSNISVKEMKAKIDLQEKYRLQRNQKDVSKEKSKFKRTCKKSPTETVKDPLAKMMRKMMAELQEIKSDVKGTNAKMDNIATKVENLEKRSAEVEESNAEKFNNLKNKIAQVENKVTDKLIKEIEPSLGKMKEDIEASMCKDLRRIVQEEVALQRMKETKEAEAVERDDSEKKKNEKIQKNNKNTKPKKIWKMKKWIPEKGRPPPSL